MPIKGGWRGKKNSIGQDPDMKLNSATTVRRVRMLRKLDFGGLRFKELSGLIFCKR